MSDGLITKKNDYPDGQITFDSEKYRLWRDFFMKYFRIRTDIVRDVEQLRDDFFHGERVVGVLCRGTDYVAQHPKNHPIQPAISDLINKTIKTLLEYSCKWVYLATEDEDAYQKKYISILFQSILSINHVCWLYFRFIYTIWNKHRLPLILFKKIILHIL